MAPDKRSDHLVRVVSKDGLFRGAATLTTGLVKAICEMQQTDLTATVALGRLLSGGALLSSLLKVDQRLALLIEGNGPLQRLSVEADAQGRLRGKVAQPAVGLPPKDGCFDVAGAVGKAGFLHVTKDLGLKQPYQSMVQLQTSEIAEDLAWYLSHSEQVPSSLGLGVELDKAGQVAMAGGFLVQALPGGDDDQVEALIAKLRQLPPTTTLLRQGLAPLDILGTIFGEVDFRVQQNQPLTFYCPCSRQQIARMLHGLGRNELTALLQEQEPVEVTCEYCRQLYRFSRAEIEQVIAMLAKT